MIGLLHPAVFSHLTAETFLFQIACRPNHLAETLIPIDLSRMLNNVPTNYKIEGEKKTITAVRHGAFSQTGDYIVYGI